MRRIDGQGTVLPGFTAQVYAGRPNASGLRSAPLPRVTSGAQIWEATLGPPPFSLFFDGAGHVTGAAGAVSTATVLPSEPPCPGGGNAMTFTIRDSRASQDRALACPEAAGGTASPP
jgi:hypothetical protein